MTLGEMALGEMTISPLLDLISFIQSNFVSLEKKHEEFVFELKMRRT